MTKPSVSKAIYSIGAVSRLTGLTTHAIRMWEHRYQAVTPVRTDSGRRTYTAADVEKLSMLKALTDRGSPISSVAGLPHKALRERLEQDQSLASGTDRDMLEVAAMGATIPALLRNAAKDTDTIRLVATGAEPQKLGADIAGKTPDALLLEFPVLDGHTVKVVQQLRGQHPSSATIVMFRFGRREHADALTREGVVTMRLPVTETELVTAISAGQGITSHARHGKPAKKKPAPAQASYAPAPDRQFNDGQLARLGDIESSIDCECPQHLSEILSALTAFEIYSHNCEETDKAQAELHAYLHNATGQARGIMEEALSRLIEVEEITV